MRWVRFGEDLFAFMSALDITSIVQDGWAEKLNRPFKADEKPTYPSFAVVPARDELGPLDSVADTITQTYSVYIFFSYWEAGVAEAEIRQLVDLVTSELARERRSPTPLGGAYDLSLSGEWGGDETQTERYYRLDVTARFAEDLEP